MGEATLKWDGAFLLDCLSRTRFRLKASARYRLAVDIAVLCTGLRAVVMVDYAMEVSQLQSQLCTLLNLLEQEIQPVSFLKVLCMDGIVYLIHIINLSLLMDGTLNHSIKLDFVVLNDDAARFASPMEKEEALNHFVSFKTCFLLQLSKDVNMPMPSFHPNMEKHLSKTVVDDISSRCALPENTSQASQSTSAHALLSSTRLIDLGSSETFCEAALPTLNGWLLGYPVVYLFKKENVSKAVRMLAVSSLQQFKLLIQSSLPFQISEGQCQKGKPVMHELTSFTIPSELSIEGVCEERVSCFMESMQVKVKNSQFWKSLELQVISKTCRSVVL